ncbi:RidA family protein [Bowmanella yangjiangensis]|uniref:RidA family protein n=1 Tax=Bowmanella yangjiangensis TaxID=2811230 RepID=A0ABS3CTG2_9ALTE|nr:RidA family protein [Bowmanella yangjiangensis]MBN7819716.1 RidA family protein [Bowmanella yangjiangensis]
MSIQRINPGKRMSDICIHNQTAYWAEVPENLQADIEVQAQDLLKLAEGTLAQVGSSKAGLISATIYLKDRSLFDGFNKIWDAWLPEGKAPVRACIIAELVNPDMLVEIVFTAAAGDQ